MVLPLRVPVAGLTAVTATLVEGPSGWGEWTDPPPGYRVDPATARRAAEEAAGGTWPLPVRDGVDVNALVPAVEPAVAVVLAVEAAAAGFRCIKVKVDHDTAAAVERVAAVRDGAGPGVALRIDANGAWDLETAVSVLDRLVPYELELAEDPVAGLDDLALLRRRVRVPLAADEAVRSVDDARRLGHLAAADAVVVKVQPLGGVAAAMAVVEAAGVPGIVSALYETSVGIAVGLALAAALPELPYACGLGTAALLAADVVAEPMVAVQGALALRRPVPDPALLARYEAR